MYGLDKCNVMCMHAPLGQGNLMANMAALLALQLPLQKAYTETAKYQWSGEVCSLNGKISWYSCDSVDYNLSRGYLCKHLPPITQNYVAHVHA